MSSENPPKEFVESLLVKGSYKTSNQSTLEAYVHAQATGECEYYFEANKALLKIYQSSRSTADIQLVATVLLLAMVEAYPSTDVLALSYLLPERFAKAESCAAVLECTRLLDSCQFVEFWTSFANIPTGDDANMTALVGQQRATAKLQCGILHVLALSHKSAKLDKVLASLNLKDAAALEHLNESCIESINGDTVVFASTVHNTKRNRVFQEGLSYGAIANLMSKVSAE